MEESILVTGNDFVDIISEQSLMDCVDVAFKKYQGEKVKLSVIKDIGHIHGNRMVIDERHLDRSLIDDYLYGEGRR